MGADCEEMKKVVRTRAANGYRTREKPNWLGTENSLKRRLVTTRVGMSQKPDVHGQPAGWPQLN